jgi:hypothetical protein
MIFSFGAGHWPLDASTATKVLCIYECADCKNVSMVLTSNQPGA